MGFAIDTIMVSAKMIFKDEHGNVIFPGPKYKCLKDKLGASECACSECLSCTSEDEDGDSLETFGIPTSDWIALRNVTCYALAQCDGTHTGIYKLLNPRLTIDMMNEIRTFLL